ncbi:MAG TPA: arginine repressor [Thermoanaerobaculia bacterium]|nr:arginine repressor [Thermoanaerobaculia bacterium]
MRRREAIRRLVAEQPVRSQKELARLLKTRGVAVAQPTLSRDIRELGLVKGPAGYAAPGEAAGAPPAAAGAASITHRRLQTFERLVDEFVLSVETAANLVVLRTPPADAQPVALSIDAAALEGVVGTLAGDDTIFIAARSAEQAEALARRFRAAMGARAAARPARFPRRRKTGAAGRRA